MRQDLFRLLKPATATPVLDPIILNEKDDLASYLPTDTTIPLIVDFETTGLDTLAFDFEAVGLGIAWSGYPQGVYMPLTERNRAVLLPLLTKYRLVAHNVVFDSLVLSRYQPDVKWNWIGDTQILYKQFAGEGFIGQRWTLKDAQVKVLGWEETNEVELDKWLIANGYTKAGSKPDKSMMWKAPAAILGHYCALDAQSTFALWKYFQRYEEQFAEAWAIHRREFMTLVKLINEQHRYGMWVNEEKLRSELETLNEGINTALDSFFTDSPATPFVQEYNDNVVQAVLEKEPAKLTKAGKTSVRWTNWNAKLAKVKDEQHFNPHSKQQLEWLFYDRLFETTEPKPKRNWKGEIEGHVFKIKLDNGTISARCTPSGRRAVDKSVLPALGRAGHLLAGINKDVKLRGYIEGMLQSLRNGVHHTQLRPAATLTLRCAGTGGVNIQQLPKDPRYLSCLNPRPGHVFIQMDVDALEPVVLAELSEDAAMMKLYGPNAKPNDIYLFVGSKIPALASHICEFGYDPDNPTIEAINLTKKKAKKWRNICKVLHLSAGYGAGPRKIWETLVQSGVDITLDEVRIIHKEYWELFGGVKEFEGKLKAEWASNGGWFLNGRHHPVAVDSRLEKDILNRCIQNTGHINLLTYLYYLDQLRMKANMQNVLKPIVCDFHDECIWEVPEDRASEAIKLFEETWKLVNDELGGIIPLSGAPELCYSFADFKCE